MDDQMKLCSKCKKEKAISDFSKNRSAKDGIERFCRACGILTRKKYKEKRSEFGAPTRRRGRKKMNLPALQKTKALPKTNNNPGEAINAVLLALKSNLFRTKIAIEVIEQLKLEETTTP